MKKTKILFVTRAYGKNAGGMERLSYEFIAEARKHDSFDVHVIANETTAGITLLKARIRSALFSLSIIPRAFSTAQKADVVHIGDPVLSLVGWVIKLFLQKPIAVTVHGLDLTYQNPLYQLYLLLFFRGFDLYLPISSYAQTCLGSHPVSGKVAVLTPGVTDRYYDAAATRQQVRDILSLPPSAHNTKILLTVGRLVQRKGHAWFIRNVLPKLPENVLYVIAGTGPADSEIQKATESAKQAGRVKLLGRVSEDALKILYNTADIFIQPNVKVQGESEGFGLVLLEAALCNRPVIASRIEGIIDAIQDSKNGMLVSPSDANAWIAAIMQTLESQSQANSREYTLKKFSWENVMTIYYSLIEQVRK